MAQDPSKSVLREVDAEARRLAKDLVRQARFGALGVLEPGTGVPLVSRVSVATDLDGAPVILISQLSAHFGALVAEARCSLLLGEPGRGDPLAHPRITLICEATRLDTPGLARDRFLRRQPKAALYADFPDFAFWRLVPQRAALNGGFGKAFEMDPEDITTPVADGWAALEAEAVAHMNADHSDALALYAQGAGLPEGAWRLTALDPEGLDLMDGERTGRVWFDPPLADPEGLRPRLVAMAKTARARTSP